jgi:1-acyl-sn-glycerol-3-phosphate acyltransferase
MGAQQRLTWKWRVIARIVIVLVSLARWWIEVRGLEHVPRRGGAVLAFNHHSYVDFVMMGWPVIRELRRPIRFLAKREIWASRWTGWVVRWAEAVPVDRGSAAARAGAFDAAIDALRRGDLVAVAPEQTISPSLELLPFRTGAARMAQGSGVPIVPVIGWGSQRFATKGSRHREVRGLPITVRFGEPIVVGPDEDPGAATARLQERMTAMLHEEQERYPGGTPAGAPWVPHRLGGGAPDHAEIRAAHEARTSRWERRAAQVDALPSDPDTPGDDTASGAAGSR